MSMHMWIRAFCFAPETGGGSGTSDASGGAGASAPTNSSSTTKEADGDDGDGIENFDFDSLVRETEGEEAEDLTDVDGTPAKIEAPVDPQGTPAPTPAPQTPEDPAKVQADPAKPTDTQVPPGQPEVQPQPVQQPAPEAAPSQQPADLSQQYANWFDQSAEGLAKQVYALPEDVAQELDANPSAVIPKLAGQLHMQVMVSTMQHMANYLPTIVPQLMEQQARARSYEDKFYDRFAELKEHREAVNRVATMYRSFDKSMRGTDPMADIAAIVRTQLRINGAPTAQPQAQPGQPQFQTPPVPASATPGVNPLTQPQRQTTVWEELAIEDS